MTRMLLDVNVWIALFDDAHLFSPAANALFDTPGLKIATCPLVENAVIRILNLPSYARIGPVGFERVRSQLKRVCELTDHQFWPDDVSLRDDVVDFARITGHNQITDAYLLALAVKHNAALASFDQAVALASVKGASAQNLRLL
jgi:uncharacterized protein